MRLFTLALVALLLLIQYPLWLGKGGWLRVWEVDRQLLVQKQSNAKLSERNRALEGEVLDLKEGTGAIEERARYELGMMRADEIFVQIGEPGAPPVTPLSALPASPARPAR
jgi:cell division protein FtsB